MCLMMAAVSAVIAIKEHKFQFQWSSNRHEALARFNIVAYLSMLVVSVVLMRFMGLDGFLLSWLLTEIVVAIYIVHQNQKLFPGAIKISTLPFYKLFFFLAVVLPLSAWPVWHGMHWNLLQVTAVAILGVLLLSVAAYFFFDLSDVKDVLMRRLNKKRSPAAA
jgi:uncharacterized membrane protein